MSDERVVTACVLIIGNEILSGRTQDVNLAHLATELNEHGIRVKEARVIPDDEVEIVTALNACRARYDYVFTTGGIGPTHDDITAECVAKALGRKLYSHPDIEALVRRREAPPDVMAARMRMALVPEGAQLLTFSFGPGGFVIDDVIVLAGVPRIMREMLASVLPKLEGASPVRSRSVSAYVTETQIATPLREIQARFDSVEIGSYPFRHNDQFATSLVVRGTDPELLDTVCAEMEQLLRGVGEVFVPEA